MDGQTVSLIFDQQIGWSNGQYAEYQNNSGSDYVSYHFKRRAPGFFDIVAYSGSGNSDAGDQVNHNLGVIPDMVWRKKRNGAENWDCLVARSYNA